ncbi:hypothetical protein, partial [Yeosuana sp.]|uniref:hypothetical protein n=1 Tax=Yeosuana sp. TaxID=2529388 RepID=UPI004054E167
TKAPLGGLMPLPIKRHWWVGSTILFTVHNELMLPLIACSTHYGKLRVCVRGFSEGKSEASKRATTKRLN